MGKKMFPSTCIFFLGRLQEEDQVYNHGVNTNHFHVSTNGPTPVSFNQWYHPHTPTSSLWLWLGVTRISFCCSSISQRIVSESFIRFHNNLSSYYSVNTRLLSHEAEGKDWRRPIRADYSCYFLVLKKSFPGIPVTFFSPMYRTQPLGPIDISLVLHACQ